MKSLNRALDRFCAKHPNFGIKNLMIYVVIGNIIAYLLTNMSRNVPFIYYIMFLPDNILKGEVWRLLTFIFIPSGSSVILFAVSLYFYYFIGSTLEKQWGKGKFTIYYFTGIILLIVFGFITDTLGRPVLLEATYLNLSMFFAFATLFPNARVLLFFFIPIKIKWLALVDAVFFVYAVVSGAFPANMIPIVATLNFFIFCFGDLLSAVKPYKYRYSPQNMHFRSEVRQTRAEADKTIYLKRCDVCGRTDISNPELEFRYCSKCAGYHCYCQDHINTHIHFKE